MSKKNNSATDQPAADGVPLSTAAGDVRQHERADVHHQSITSADLDDVLALLPASQTALVAAQRYGMDTWPMIEAVRNKLGELKERIK